MMRASVFRLSPLLLLAAALVALAVLFTPGAQPAQAQTTAVWSATLTVAQVTSTIEGCSNLVSASECSSTSVLTDDDFTYDSVDYTIAELYVDGDRLGLRLNKTVPAALKSALTLHVGSSQFPLADATLGSNTVTHDSISWTNSGLSWSVGDTVSVSLTDPTVTTEYWSDTLDVKAVDYGFGCGYRTGQPLCGNALTSILIIYHGALYEVELVHVAYGDTLQLILDADPVDSDGTRTERSRMALNVGSKQFLVKDAQVSYGIADGNVWTNEDAWVLTWTNSGLSWSDGDSVSLSIVTLPVGGL